MPPMRGTYQSQTSATFIAARQKQDRSQDNWQGARSGCTEELAEAQLGCAIFTTCTAGAGGDASPTLGGLLYCYILRQGGTMRQVGWLLVLVAAIWGNGCSCSDSGQGTGDGGL